MVTLIYFIATFGLALLVANFVKSQQAAMLFMILVFFIPSFFLTGLILPIDTSSPVMAIVSGMLPASHYVVLSRGVFLKGLASDGIRQPDRDSAHHRRYDVDGQVWRCSRNALADE